jgi:hypothetical protein
MLALPTCGFVFLGGVSASAEPASSRPDLYAPVLPPPHLLPSPTEGGTLMQDYTTDFLWALDLQTSLFNLS